MDLKFYYLYKKTEVLYLQLSSKHRQYNAMTRVKVFGSFHGFKPFFGDVLLKN